MNEILLCNRPLTPQALHHQCGIGIDHITAVGCTKPTAITAYTPYLTGNDHTSTGQAILNQFSPSPVAKKLTHLSLSYGGDNVLALAEINAQLNDFNIGLLGASTSVYANRMGVLRDPLKSIRQP